MGAASGRTPWKRKWATTAEVELERGSPVAVVEGEEPPMSWLCHASPRAHATGLPLSAAARRGGDEEEERGAAAARVEEMGPVRRRVAKSRWARVPRHRARRTAGHRVDSPDGTKKKGGASARRPRWSAEARRRSMGPPRRASRRCGRSCGTRQSRGGVRAGARDAALSRKEQRGARAMR
jgi:hypothetical protein